MSARLKSIAATATASAVSLVFVYPLFWMLVGSFRTTEEILTAPLRLLPEAFRLDAYRDILSIGGVGLLHYAWNSALITGASTAVAVIVAALGAYALTRKPDLPGFRLIRYGFLLTIMYPYMLLVIPAYIVMYHLGLLGTYTGIVLFLSLGPIQFFLFEQFFRTLPPALIEAAVIDGASERQILFKIILPVAAPIVGTVTLISFLTNWAQWFPVLVISRSPETYTLPVALLALNSELGTNFQAIMALATLSTLPVVVVFLFAQKRVMHGLTAGAVKG
jgi:ABC-type glycerol-3-phosphate transport system permease component